MNPYRELFQLDPQIVFLNHGSFGACPHPVFEAYQAWQRELERQPVLFLGRQIRALERQARRVLGEFLNAAEDDLVFVPNATHGVNIVAHSLALGPDDEILTSDHEYGACANTWKFIAQKTGVRIIRQPIPLPILAPDVFVENFWQGVTPHTRLIYLSQISSPTAQRFPIESICQRARQEGILTLIDGAHAPGQIPLDLRAIEADFYTGNCHKWMLSPKGAGFLFARREVQALIEPLVVSWGYSADEKTTTGSRFIDLLEWTGTRDPAAALSVPAAIHFLQENNWEEVRQDCNRLLCKALSGVDELTGLASAYSDNPDLTPQALPPQMGVVRLPQGTDLEQLKETLYNRWRIEVPTILWNDQKFLRISIQAYTGETDVAALITGIGEWLKSPG